MTDNTELKRLAEASLGDWYEVGELRCEDRSGYINGLHHDDEYFIAAANPAAVLALIAENERVKARLCVCRDCGGQGEVYSGHSSYQGHNQPPEPDMDVCGTCGGDGVLGQLEDFESIAAERDQLKADIGELRREREGKVLCDLELFETLRDSANTEADEHRQCMATYRPLRQANLDSVVKKCDDLLAAMGKGEQS